MFKKRLTNQWLISIGRENGYKREQLVYKISSRPMGWNIKGCDKISKLIAYYHNGGETKKLFTMERKLNYEIINFKDVQKTYAIKTKTGTIKKNKK